MDKAADALLTALRSETYHYLRDKRGHILHALGRRGLMTMCYGCLWPKLLERLESEGKQNMTNYRLEASARLRDDAGSRAVALRVGLITDGNRLFKLRVQLPWLSLSELFGERIQGYGDGCNCPFGWTVSDAEAHEAAQLVLCSPVALWQRLDKYAFDPFSWDEPRKLRELDVSLQSCKRWIARWQRGCYVAKYLALLHCNVCVVQAVLHCMRFA